MQLSKYAYDQQAARQRDEPVFERERVGSNELVRPKWPERDTAAVANRGGERER